MFRKLILTLALGSALAGLTAGVYAQEAPKPEGEKPELQQDSPKPEGEKPELQGERN